MIIIGLDDTDMPGTPGTNQLARQIADALPDGLGFDVALRHQLLFDDRIPYTSKNGSASIGVVGGASAPSDELLGFLRERVRTFAPPGSDPGLCVAYAAGGRGLGYSGGDASDAPAAVPSARPPTAWADLIDFARRCQRQPVRQEDALALAEAHGIVLEPLGGTGGGVIGALAAVGLRAGGDDGRVVHRPGWPWPDPFVGEQPVGAVLARGVDEIRGPGGPVTDGVVDLGKRLRPSFRGGRVVVFVEPADTDDVGTASSHRREPGAGWKALKLP